MKPLHKPEICTCGHAQTLHRASETTWPCGENGCKCTRYDRRNFSDAELEQLELEQLEQQRAKLAAVLAVAGLEPIDDATKQVIANKLKSANALPAPPAEPDPRACSLDGRRVLAPERIGAALGRLVDHLERVDQRANPCPAGGRHHWVHVSPSDPEVRCSKCTEKGPHERPMTDRNEMPASKLQRPCPGCPVLTWVLEGEATCSDCGCTLSASQDVDRRTAELVIASRALPQRLRSFPLLFALAADVHPFMRPPLTASELRALERFRWALLNLWAFDERP